MSSIRSDALLKKKPSARPSRSCEQRVSVETLTIAMAVATIGSTREVVHLLEAVPEMTHAVAAIAAGLKTTKVEDQKEVATEDITDEKVQWH